MADNRYENKYERIMAKIAEELKKARHKFPKWPSDPIHAAAILNEETGEVTKTVLEWVYEPSKGVMLSDIEAELVQVAAMAIRMLMNVDMYEKIDTFQETEEDS